MKSGHLSKTALYQTLSGTLSKIRTHDLLVRR